jgi:hypothetical protein
MIEQRSVILMACCLSLRDIRQAGTASAASIARRGSLAGRRSIAEMFELIGSDCRHP